MSTHQGLQESLPQAEGNLCGGQLSLSVYRLAGLVVKASASGAEDPGFESR